MEVPKERSGTGDHKPGRVGEGHRAYQPLAQEGGGQGLRGRPCHEAGLHTSQEHLAQHVEVLQGTLMGRDLPITSRGGLRIYYESCLNLVEHKVFGVSRCQKGWFVNPGYPVGAESEARGMAKDNVLWANHANTTVPSG